MFTIFIFITQLLEFSSTYKFRDVSFVLRHLIHVFRFTSFLQITEYLTIWQNMPSVCDCASRRLRMHTMSLRHFIIQMVINMILTAMMEDNGVNVMENSPKCERMPTLCGSATLPAETTISKWGVTATLRQLLQLPSRETSAFGGLREIAPLQSPQQLLGYTGIPESPAAIIWE